MKRRDFLYSAVVAAPLGLMHGTPAIAQLPGGVDELVRELGFALEIPLNKAVAGTGALFHIARKSLPESEFAQVSTFISGVERLIQQASNVIKADLPASLSGMPVVMEKLQLSNNATRQFEEFILDYLRSRGSRKIVGLLQKAWRY